MAKSREILVAANGGTELIIRNSDGVVFVRLDVAERAIENALQEGIAMPGPEEKRLAERQFRGIHVSWGPDAAQLTPEERATVINDVLDHGEAQDRERVSVRLSDLRIVYEGMKRVQSLGQQTIEEYIAASPELRNLRHQIGIALGMALAHAGQMLPREEYLVIRDKLREEEPVKPTQAAIDANRLFHDLRKAPTPMTIGRAHLEEIEVTLEQVHSFLLGGTPGTGTAEEARADTLDKVKEALVTHLPSVRTRLA